MADYFMEKCTFGQDKWCRKNEMIKPLAKYVAQYDKIHQDHENMGMGNVKVKIYNEVHVSFAQEQVANVRDMKDRITQRGSRL